MSVTTPRPLQRRRDALSPPAMGPTVTAAPPLATAAYKLPESERAARKALLEKVPEDELKKAFSVIDKNADGHLTRAEVIRAVRKDEVHAPPAPRPR